MAQQKYTPKQRMLNAYRGVFCDRVAIAPAFWTYFPAKLLGVDMITFQREVPHHLALKQAFEKFDCDGWGSIGLDTPAADVEYTTEETWVADDCLEVRTTAVTPHGTLTGATRYDRAEPCWTVERAIKDPARDLRAWEDCTFAEPEQMDLTRQMNARKEVADSYLLEVKLGTPFFDAYAQHREGGVEPAVMDMIDNERLFEGLRDRYVDHMVRKARVVCQRTDFEVMFIGCGWSCNSVIGPQMWRRWDRPVIEGVAEEVHAHGRLLHIHFGGKCAETISDFAALGVDCVCSFERPPGGDISGPAGLKKAAAALGGRTTFNGNVHTVQTLVGGTPADVRREVGQILKAFAANPRLIVGTGDQVARETPPENIIAMIDEAKRLSPDWLGGA